jgi:type II secretory pathway pseudopilin PulG
MTKPSLAPYKRFFIIIGIVCLAAIILNLAVRRGPVKDANAVDDLRSISGAIEMYYSNQSRLPTDLADVKSSLSAATKQRLSAYDYVPVTPVQYRLCASFESASSDKQYMTYPIYGNPDPGQHEKGHQCFVYTVNANNGGAPKPL